MIGVIWNCRGLAQPSTVQQLRAYITVHRPSFVFLSETKISAADSSSTLRSLGFPFCVAISACNTGGGVCLAFSDSNVIDVVYSDSNIIAAVVDYPSQLNCRWLFCGVYGPPKGRDLRLQFLDRLDSIISTFDGPVVCAGDFNCLLRANDKIGGRTVGTSSSLPLRTFMDHAGLVDLGFSGSRYTWTNGQGMNTHIRERLDRAVANIVWRELFPKATVTHLPRTTSDHSALLLQLNGEVPNFGRPFKFEAMWLRESSCLDVIFSAWTKPQQGSAAFKLAARIREVKMALKEWNKRVFGHVGTKIKELLAELESVQSADPTEANLRKEATLQLELVEQRQREELLWKQKSRIQWLLEGDGNNRFFHVSSITRRRFNSIDGLKVQSGWITEKSEIEDAFCAYYENLFTASNVDPPGDLERLLNPCITTEENSTLLAIPTHDEVKKIVFKMGANKAPGPDGMSGSFYKAAWNFIGGDVVVMVQNFFRSGYLLKQLNHTFISLAPKAPGACQVQNFRPIALCNYCYKIISKLIANRLRPLMKRLISPMQSAFVPGRSIHDNVIIAKEVMHYMAKKKGKQGVMAAKIDLAKAYDKVEWPFLLTILKCFGFEERFIKLIQECVSTVSYSVLINGVPSRRIIPQRGLRQGDPISPYLFIMCTEVLSRLIMRAVETDELKGVKIAPRCEMVHHLLYADDLVIFATATTANAESIQECLDTFELWSGQQANKQKSGLFCSKNTSRSVKRSIKSSLNLKSIKKADVYLGHPLMAKGTKRKDFQFVIDKLAGRLAGWKRKLLSFAGRTTLTQAVLQTIPSYMMQTHKIPLALCDDIDKISRDFWWGKQEGSPSTIYYRSWRSICRPKKFGGLGFKRARDFNIAALAKLSWKAVTDADSPWVNLLKTKYCQKAPFLELKQRNYDSPIWKAILYGRSVIKLGMCYRVGDGRDIDIWKVPWVPNFNTITPKSISPEIASTIIKPSRVHELIARDGSTWRWDRIEIWFEPDVATAIKNIQLPLLPTRDKLIWGSTKDGFYSMASGYLLVLQGGHATLPLVEDPIYKKIWCLDIQNRHKVLLWRIHSKCLPTMTALHRRITTVSTVCPICSIDDEDEVHVFLRCQHARLLWRYIWGLDVVLLDWNFSHCLEVILCPSKIGIPPDRAAEFTASICIALDKLWHWRNKVVRGGKTMDPALLIREVMSATSDLLAARRSIISDDISSIVTNRNHQIWSPPPLHSVKINFDASYREGVTIAAAVARSADGTVIDAVIGKGMDASALQAEARAARLAMMLAHFNTYTDFIIEGDNLSVISFLNGSAPTPWWLENCMLDIKRLATSDQRWTALHVYREANQVAHLLAKGGCPELPLQTHFHRLMGLPMAAYHAATNDWAVWRSSSTAFSGYGLP